MERTGEERDQFLALRERLETLLTQVLTAEKHYLGSESAEQICEWIDHYEFGLAFEALQDAVRAQSITLSKPSIEAMKEAAELMEL